LTADRLNITFKQNGSTVTAVAISSLKQDDSSDEGSASALAGGETTVRVFLNITGTPDGKETIEITPVDGISIYDKAGNASTAEQTTGEMTLKDCKAPEGYSVSIDQSAINSANQTALSFTITNAEVGTVYNYSIDDEDENTEAVIGSGTVSASDETISSIDISSLSDGELTLTVTLTDGSGNTGDEVIDTVTKDIVLPTLTVVSISSDNADPTLAKVGDKITLDITASEDIKEPVITIAGQNATIIDAGDIEDSTWQAEYTMQSGDPVGAISFTVDFEDIAGNDGVQATETIDSSQVVFDESAPAGYGVSIDQEHINISNQIASSFTFSGAEVGTTYNYSIDDEDENTEAVIGSGTVSASDETISSIDLSSLSDGELTLTVTLTDGSGNIGDEVIDTVEKDTVEPEIVSLSPADGAEDVGIYDNLEIRFNEIIAANSGNILIKKTADDSIFETIDIKGSKISGSGTDTITISPHQDLAGDTGYYILIGNEVLKDRAGNSFSGLNEKTAWNFKTTGEPEIQLSMTDSYENGETLAAGETITYNITIRNTGLTSLKDAEIIAQIPSNTSYVKGTTKINGQTIIDDNGNCPLLEGYSINSPGSAEGVIGNQGESDYVSVSYQVKIISTLKL